MLTADQTTAKTWMHGSGSSARRTFERRSGRGYHTQEPHDWDWTYTEEQVGDDVLAYFEAISDEDDWVDSVCKRLAIRHTKGDI